jgi:uncharacterized cupin superfamily protein
VRFDRNASCPNAALLAVPAFAQTAAAPAGMCAGFAAGDADGHQLINRSGEPAVYLEISNRARQEDTAPVSP